jgi:hypothetical protein
MIDEDDFWSNWWNKNWQGKPKYSEKIYPGATLSTTKSHMTDYWISNGSNLQLFPTQYFVLIYKQISGRLVSQQTEIKNVILWVTTPRGLVKVRHFGGTYRIHLHGRRVGQARNKQKKAVSWTAQALRLWVCFVKLRAKRFSTATCPDV